MKEHIKYFLVGFIPLALITGALYLVTITDFGVYLILWLFGAWITFVFIYVLGMAICSRLEKRKEEREEERKWARLKGGRF